VVIKNTRTNAWRTLQTPIVLLGGEVLPTRTIRRQLLTVPGRITRTSRRVDTPDASPLALGARVPHRAQRLRAIPTPT
jgi:hypothetical protein